MSQKVESEDFVLLRVTQHEYLAGCEHGCCSGLQMIWKCLPLAVQHLELVVAAVEGWIACELAGYLVLGDQIVFGQVISHLCDWVHCDVDLQNRSSSRAINRSSSRALPFHECWIRFFIDLTVASTLTLL